MESNVLRYKDQTPAKPLSKDTLNKMVWRSLFLQASFNFERMQAAGWLYGILPGLEEIHKDKEDLSASMSHNLDFFNTHPFLVTFVMGIVLSLETQKADIGTIRAVRVAAMGPLGGIGDAIFWFTLLPITAGISAHMAIDGNIAGPILFFVLFNVVQFGIRFWLMHWSYNLGTNAIGLLTKHAKEFTHAASMLGVFIVGALTSNYGATKIMVKLKNGIEKIDEVTKKEIIKYIDFQKILDGILPQLIPLAFTLILYFLIRKKKWTPVMCIFLLLIVGVVGAAFGIWDGSYTPLVKWY